MNKNDLYDFIYNEFLQVNDFQTTDLNKNKSNIEKLVNDLLNLDIDCVKPLNKEMTFLIRSHYGIFDNGKRQTLISIAKKMGVSYECVRKNIIKCKTILYWSILIPKLSNTKEKISSLELSDRYEELKNIPAASIYKSDKIFYMLKDMNIKTLDELLSYGYHDFLFQKGFGMGTLKDLLDGVHALNLKFIEELSDVEKSNLIMNSDETRKLKSSIWFLDGIDEKLYEKYKSIGDILKYVEEPISRIEKSTVNSLTKLGFYVPKENRIELIYNSLAPKVDYKSFSIDDILKIRLDIVNLKRRKIENALLRRGINTIGDLIKFNTNNLYKFCDLEEKDVNELISLVHALGLLFSDEVKTLNTYSKAIQKQLSNH